MKALLALAVLALALAGCTTPAEPVTAPGPAGPSTSEGPAPEAGPGAASAPGPLGLFFTPDLGFAVEPAAAGTVTPTTPVNGPETPGYPVWSGTLPAAVNVTSTGIAVTLYVQSNTASVRANQVPVFADLPAMFLELEVGDLKFSGQADGPGTMHIGHIHEVTAVLAGKVGEVPPGAEVWFQAAPIYSHVTVAAEFQFVMGPDQPARLDFA